MTAVPNFQKLRALDAQRSGGREGGFKAPQAAVTFEAAVKLTQMLLAGQSVTARLIVERFDVSGPTAARWMQELEQLLPVERVAAPRVHVRGPLPVMLRLPAKPGVQPPQTGGSRP